MVTVGVINLFSILISAELSDKSFMSNHLNGFLNIL